MLMAGKGVREEQESRMGEGTVWSRCEHDEKSAAFAVLIVDDDNVCRTIQRATVQKKLGITPTVARNGREAVDLYHSGEFFNLVFMNMEMPVMNGLEATKELRAMGVESMIVGVTSYGEGKERDAFMAAGLDKCLEKPLTDAMVGAIMVEYQCKCHETCIYCGAAYKNTA